MTEVQLLFLVLAAIYLIECLSWSARGGIGVVTWLGWRWSLAHPSLVLGNQRGGVVFAWPVPPMGTIFIAHPFSLSVSPEGILAFVSTTVCLTGRAPQSGRFLAFGDIKTISATGKKILINGEVFLKTGSLSSAGRLAETLRSLLALTPEKRKGAIEKLFRDSLDTKAIETRSAEFRKAVVPIRWLCNALFLFVFAASPVILWHLGLLASWPWILAGLLSLTTSTAIVFWRVHKRLYPEAEDERFTQFILVWLSPATTLRTADLISRHLLDGFHPLAVAKVFCGEARFLDYARLSLRELRYPALPVCPNTAALACETERLSRQALLESVEAFLRRHKLSPDVLDQAPEPTDPACRSYCPRCLAQFTATEGACPDCGGMPLKKLLRKG